MIIRSPLVINHRFYFDIDHVRPYPPEAVLNYFSYEQQQKKSAYMSEELGRYYTRIYAEFDPHQFTNSIFKWVNHLLKLSWVFFGLPVARPNNYGLILQKKANS